MYITAHRVRRGALTGINAYLHLHRGATIPGIDWNHPDIALIADRYPGGFVVQRTEVEPGNNPVYSYLMSLHTTE